MRILLVYFSRGGFTRDLMADVAGALGHGDLVEIKTARPAGVVKLAVKTLWGGELPLLPVGAPLPLYQYDLAILGTPVYAERVSAPLRDFLRQNGKTLQRTAHVITHSRPSGYETVLSELDSLTGQRRCAALDVSKSAQNRAELVRAFVAALPV